MLPRKGSAVAALLLAGALFFPGTSAYAAPEDQTGWLELHAGADKATYRLTPGGSAHWPVDVHVRGQPAVFLEVGLEEGADPDDVLRRHLAVRLQACTEPWVDNRCGAGQRVLLERAALESAGGVRADLMPAGAAVSAGDYVLLTAWLAEDVPQEVQGTATQIVVGVHAGGDHPGAGPTDDMGTGPPGESSGPLAGPLADTGARLGAFTLLGLLAVAVGFGLARLRAARA